LVDYLLIIRFAAFCAHYGWLTTVDLWPITGRKHQLHLHMARLGHPIVGDDSYHGHQQHDGFFSSGNGSKRRN
jgi:23S rRNA-/tRNA-specific pseudouridylate synthase